MSFYLFTTFIYLQLSVILISFCAYQPYYPHVKFDEFYKPKGTMNTKLYLFFVLFVNFGLCVHHFP